jgi:hypothetical protein
MGIIGEDLNAFLRAWTAYYLLVHDRDAAAAGLNALELPEHLSSDDPPGSTEWLLMLFSHGTSYPKSREDVAYAVEHLALNAAHDNAEAVDHTARGEPGWRPHWRLPDRAPRRQ